MVCTLLQPPVTSARLTPYLYLSTPLPAGAFYLTRSKLSLPIYLRYRHPIIVFTVNVVRSARHISASGHFAFRTFRRCAKPDTSHFAYFEVRNWTFRISHISQVRNRTLRSFAGAKPDTPQVSPLDTPPPDTLRESVWRRLKVLIFEHVSPPTHTHTAPLARFYRRTMARRV